MAEVEKFSTFDPRIVQTKPKYAVSKGALAVSNVSFKLIFFLLNPTGQIYKIII